MVKLSDMAVKDLTEKCTVRELFTCSKNFHKATRGLFSFFVSVESHEEHKPEQTQLVFNYKKKIHVHL